VGTKRLESRNAKTGFSAFLEQHSRSILGLFVVVLVVHDVFGAHGFIAMRRTQNEIEKVKKEIDRLNSENIELGRQVKALKTDPRLIEKIAREELQQAKPGEIIIRIPASQQPSQDLPAKP
jgi:cell division protein FtsL